MKKILIIILSLSILTGCGINNLKKYYSNMKIGEKLESYQMDLRIYGSIDNKKINNTIKIDNYKNEEYKIENNEGNFYIKNNKLYEDMNKKPNLDFDNMKPEEIEQALNNYYNNLENPILKETNKEVYYDTDLILKGINSFKSVKEIENDLELENLKTYKFKLKKSYVNDLLNKLGYSNNYKEATGKIYLENDHVYRIFYTIDELNISASFFRLNDIDKLNINI